VRFLEPETENDEIKQEPEKIVADDKYKLSFLQIDKRLVNLEIALGELSEKIKGLKTVDPESVNAIQQGLDDLEDLAMLEDLGGTELKKMLEDINSQISELSKKTAALSPEDYQKIENLLMNKINEKISASPSLPPNQITGLQEEVARLNEKTRILETDVINKVVSEVTDLRTEMSKEMRDVKERIGEIGTIKPEIDIKFLSSRLNSLKESVEYMLNRKAELDMKMDNLQKSLAQLALKVEQVPVETARSEFPSSVDQRLSNLENRIAFLSDEVKSKEFEDREKMEEPKIDFDVQINRLLERIDYLENRIKTVEKGTQKSRREPIIVE